MKVKIHTQGWVGDAPKDEGEEADGSIHVLLEVDGVVFDAVTRVAVIASNDSFTKIVATLIPGELETVVHDRDSWDELLAFSRNSRTRAYRGRLPWKSLRRSPT